MNYKYSSHSRYPFNKPVIKTWLEGVELDVLVDQGAGISVISKSWVINNSKKPHFYALQHRLICYGYDKDPRKHAEKDVATIHEVLYAEITFFDFQVPFPCSLPSQ